MLELEIKLPLEATIGKFEAGLNDKIRDKLLIDHADTYEIQFKGKKKYEASNAR